MYYQRVLEEGTLANAWNRAKKTIKDKAAKYACGSALSQAECNARKQALKSYAGFAASSIGGSLASRATDSVIPKLVGIGFSGYYLAQSAKHRMKAEKERDKIKSKHNIKDYS